MTSAFEQAWRREQAEQVAYWRYQLIRDAADPGLSPRARGRLVRSLAGSVLRGPFGEETQVSRQTVDRWIRTWRAGGFTALQPPLRQVTARTPAEVLDLAAALKREQPDRTAGPSHTTGMITANDADMLIFSVPGQRPQFSERGSP